MRTHSTRKLSRRQTCATTMVVALQAVMMLSLLTLAGSELARRLHPVSTGTLSLSALRADAGVVNPTNGGRLFFAPDQKGCAKARPTDPSGDALLPLDYRLICEHHSGPMAAQPSDIVLAATKAAFQPRAPPTSSV